MQTTKRRSPELAAAKSADNILVEFLLDMPKAGSVAVAGSFNNWDVHQTPLRKTDRGIWQAMVALPPGRYEYRFVVDGQWFSDPKARESRPNSFGSENSVRVVEPPPVALLAPITTGSQSHISTRRQLRA
jgi:1,4-alpha-glucan branching enzyme